MNRTAAEAYAAKQVQIAQQIAALQSMLEEHAARQAREPQNWGFVGDLVSISEGLAQTVYCIGVAA